MMALFYVLPRVPATSTGALNFEPIALLVLTRGSSSATR